MKKLLAILLICLLLLPVSGGCGMSLPEGLDRGALEAAAADVTKLIVGRDFAAVYALLREDVRETTDVDEIKTLLEPRLDEMGEFEEISGFASTGQKIADSGEKYALIVVACEYEKGKKSFNLSFDADLRLLGIYMK